jgi:hypothetical protein
MADVDLTGDIALAVDGAALRGATLVIGYVTDTGAPALSYRGSALVYGPQQLAVWTRNPEDGLATGVGERPLVSLLYFSPDSPGPRYLSFRGRAHVDPSANERVYAEMIEGERNQDPDAKGVAVIIDVDRVDGFGADGAFRMERAAD